jgi:hypothetical protein
VSVVILSAGIDFNFTLTAESIARMKILLAILLCPVLTASECFAISGGPVFGKGQVRTTGNYAGVFVPAAMDNSLGLFTTTIPRTGMGTGTVAFFRNGIFYPNGTIQALADPDSAVLTGVIQSSFNVTFTSEVNPVTGTTKNIVITFQANGSIKGKIRANSNIFSTAAARITGKGAITYSTIGSAPGFDSGPANSGGPISYKVSGFKQSEVSQ